jgi:hypothetical protein
MCREANRHPTKQIVPKCSRVAVEGIAITFEPALFYVAEVCLGCDHCVWFEKIKVNGCRAKAKVDTGARVNVLSKHHLHALGIRAQQFARQ